MGMAASQARFLQLTARRSNVEYQGQQINQQRLALANESAGLMQKQLALTVPVPPSSTDDKYNKPSYDFYDPTDDLKKNIVFEFDTDGETIIGYEVTYNKYSTDGSYQTITRKNTDATPIYTITTSGLSYSPTTNTVSLTGGTAGTTYVGGIEVDSNSGRVSSMIIALATGATTVSTNSSGSVALTYSAKFDERAYNDDMNKYEYRKATYEYEIEKINAQTADIQRKDQSLELKMKQLDTEHTAIQTEIEAVQKVITTNIDASYKTFGS